MQPCSSEWEGVQSTLRGEGVREQSGWMHHALFMELEAAMTDNLE